MIETTGFDEVYCYPNSNVLKNIQGIRNQDILHELERGVSLQCISVLKDKPCRGSLDYQHLKDIHKAIFGKIYAWAGKERTVDIAKSNLFCRYFCIGDMAEDIFSKLEKDNYLIGTGRENFVKKLAYYFGEINALHPFREGNGRSQREFMRCVAAVAGYELKLENVNKEQYLNASIQSFMGKYDELEQLIDSCITKMPYQQHFAEMRKIAKAGSNLSKECQNYIKKIKRINQDIMKHGYLPTDKVIYKIERISEAVLESNMSYNSDFIKLKDINQLNGKDKNIDSLISDLKGNLRRAPFQDLAP